jgi:hypothetical protein
MRPAPRWRPPSQEGQSIPTTGTPLLDALLNQPVDLRIGSDVYCADSKAGKVERVVISPRRLTVTHLIVGRGTLPGYFDIALRDFGLALGALALARLATAFDRV